MERFLRTFALLIPLFAVSTFAVAQQTTTSGSTASSDGAAPATGGSEIKEETLGGDETLSSGEFNKRLLTVEEKVNSLKEQVFRSKATLQLLKEIVVQGSTSGARAVIWHVNELGATYAVQSVSYFLDGTSIYSKAAVDGSLNKTREFKLHDGAISSGNHTLSVSMILRGNGFGVFSYVDRYTFNVQSSYAFTAEDGKSCEVWVRLRERKGIGRSFIERPAVEYDFSCSRIGQMQ